MQGGTLDYAGTQAVDIYGFGRVLWQIITGESIAGGEGRCRLPR